MLAAERLERIAKHLQEHEFLDLATAMRALDASLATVRRDFAELVAQGRAERQRGGVARVRRDALAMAPFAERAMQQAEAKSAIARAAAALLAPGDAVFVDGGSSTLHLASHLGAVPVRVITNSLRLAAAVGAADYPNPVEVLCTGGTLVRRGGLLIGPQARAGVAAYRARWAFLSAGGVAPDGVWNTDELVQDIERAMAANAERTLVLADHTKLGRRALCRVLELGALHGLVTDDHPDGAAARAALASAGLAVTAVAAE
jgi:DeoR/GlpR family transcriptional regulator of sugar metabolism